ncbi:MAG: thiamine-monophosphate kinase [Candidatus Omnitrophota bacterium]
MKLRDIGEIALINKIAALTKTPPSVFKGIGDDCAVLKYTKDKYLLVTTDMIIEDAHFRLDKASPEQIGHKAMAVNISDIAACAGKAKWALVSVGLPKDISVDFIKRLYLSMHKTASEFGISIVGGDTNFSKKMVLSVTLIGEVSKKRLALRSGAKDQDVIFITGALRPYPNDLGFSPRIKEAQFLADNFKINSMIDISDSLALDLWRILSESKKGAKIYESLIPYEGASVKRALTTGEQFELLFTTAKKDAKRLLSSSKKRKIKITAIGEITNNAGRMVLVDRRGKESRLEPEGYEHF